VGGGESQIEQTVKGASGGGNGVKERLDPSYVGQKQITKIQGKGREINRKKNGFGHHYLNHHLWSGGMMGLPPPHKVKRMELPDRQKEIDCERFKPSEGFSYRLFSVARWDIVGQWTPNRWHLA